MRQRDLQRYAQAPSSTVGVVELAFVVGESGETHHPLWLDESENGHWESSFEFIDFHGVPGFALLDRLGHRISGPVSSIAWVRQGGKTSP